tara:strand:+ start:1284 stop:1760 length:477 start_codon:yes stop_codon:yes gene_type:complete
MEDKDTICIVVIIVGIFAIYGMRKYMKSSTTLTESFTGEQGGGGVTAGNITLLSADQITKNATQYKNRIAQVYDVTGTKLVSLMNAMYQTNIDCPEKYYRDANILVDIRKACNEAYNVLEPGNSTDELVQTYPLSYISDHHTNYTTGIGHTAVCKKNT